MEVLTKEIKEINNYFDLENILKLLQHYYDHDVNDKLYNESSKKLHEILDEKKHNLYLELGLNYLNLNQNEFNFNDITELIEHLENNKINYIYEITGFNYYGYYLYYFYENDFNINIVSEYHIIIDFENKAIYNLDLNNIDNILFRLIDKDILNWENLQYEYNKINSEFSEQTILLNDPETMEIYKLNLGNCTNYNKKDKYIIYDSIKGNWETSNELIYNMPLSELITELINENDIYINILLEY